jgi:hypothetical protein
MAQQFRAGGLPGFVVSADNLAVVLRELRDLDPNLRKELVSEMKTGITPIAKNLLAKLPGKPPLSGFAPSVGNSPYIFRTPGVIVKTPFAKRGKVPGTYPVVSIQFNDRRPNAGLSILELAGSANVGRDKGGLTPQGSAMIRNLNNRHPVRKGLGRFVIPDFKDKQADAQRIASNILTKFANKVNKKIGGL